ncbi:calmodulin-like 3 [Coemansia sp. RSA 455]|nr:calmodulin-like 3 [Coemansia sp. RSA 455]
MAARMRGKGIKTPANKPPTNKERIAEYRAAFAQFDKDGDGNIATADLKETLIAAGQNPSDEEVQAMCKKIDEDGSGTVDLEEFLALMQKKTPSFHSRKTISETIKSNFKIFDKDGDRRISLVELYDTLAQIDNNLTDREIRQMIAASDTNKDGLVSYEEFLEAKNIK